MSMSRLMGRGWGLSRKGPKGIVFCGRRCGIMRMRFAIVADPRPPKDSAHAAALSAARAIWIISLLLLVTVVIAAARQHYRPPITRHRTARSERSRAAPRALTQRTEAAPARRATPDEPPNVIPAQGWQPVVDTQALKLLMPPKDQRCWCGLKHKVRFETEPGYAVPSLGSQTPTPHRLHTLN
jgi:hypothetical protein